MRIAIGSDHNGFDLKEHVKRRLAELGHETVDFGTAASEPAVDYPDVGVAVAEAIARKEFERGILICGTGIGMAMVANKIPGVRAACCHDPYSAERARKSNNAQIMAMGAEVVGPSLADVLVDHWLSSEFAGGRSVPKVAKIDALDERYHRSTSTTQSESLERQS